jgi:hypothetical protein
MNTHRVLQAVALPLAFIFGRYLHHASPVSLLASTPPPVVRQQPADNEACACYAFSSCTFMHVVRLVAPAAGTMCGNIIAVKCMLQLVLTLWELRDLERSVRRTWRPSSFTNSGTRTAACFLETGVRNTETPSCFKRRDFASSNCSSSMGCPPWPKPWRERGQRCQDRQPRLSIEILQFYTTDFDSILWVLCIIFGHLFFARNHTCASISQLQIPAPSHALNSCLPIIHQCTYLPTLRGEKPVEFGLLFWTILNQAIRPSTDLSLCPFFQLLPSPSRQMKWCWLRQGAVWFLGEFLCWKHYMGKIGHVSYYYALR